MHLVHTGGRLSSRFLFAVILVFLVVAVYADTAQDDLGGDDFHPRKLQRNDLDRNDLEAEELPRGDLDGPRITDAKAGFFFNVGGVT